MKTAIEMIIERGIKFPASRSPRDFNLKQIVMEEFHMTQIKDVIHFYYLQNVVVVNGTLEPLTINNIINPEWPTIALRKLSDMTEEEKVYFKEFPTSHSGDGHKQRRREAARTAWLFKERFDLFELIENNLAIDAATL